MTRILLVAGVLPPGTVGAHDYPDIADRIDTLGARGP